jgi:hypothetical protein
MHGTKIHLALRLGERYALRSELVEHRPMREHVGIVRAALLSDAAVLAPGRVLTNDQAFGRRKRLIRTRVEDRLRPRLLSALLNRKPAGTAPAVAIETVNGTLSIGLPIIAGGLFGTLDHHLGRSHFVIGARWRGLHVDDDRVLDIDQVIETIAELNALVALAAGPNAGPPARSPLAPCGRRRGLRSNRWWVLRCAKRISTFLRSSHERLFQQHRSQPAYPFSARMLPRPCAARRRECSSGDRPDPSRDGHRRRPSRAKRGRRAHHRGARLRADARHGRSLG